MVEGKRREKIFGRNRHDKIIYTNISELKEGDIVDVKIDYAGPWAMKGEVINL